MVVLHYTAMADAAGALRALCDPKREVSAHYLIGRDGTVWHLVDEAKRAWHAGAGAWGDVRDVNSRSIGIELDNDGYQPFSAPLMTTLERLLPRILQRWAIPAQRVIAHSDMAPGRKIDPGARFDWHRLARQELAVWPETLDQVDSGAGLFLKYAQAFGYSAEADPAQVLAAFRLRFRPGASGPVDPADARLAKALAQRFPVDRGAPIS